MKKGQKASVETRKKIKDNHWSTKMKMWWGYKVSKANLGRKPWHAGQKLPKEMRDKVVKTLVHGWNKGKTGYHIHTEKHKQELREKFTKNNPMSNPASLEKMRQTQLKRLEEFPELHINRVLAKNNRCSKQQMKLFYKLKEKYPDAILNYRLETTEGNCFLDVGIPSLKKGYEYDGTYWHQDKDKDAKRDLSIIGAGWGIVHLKEDTLEDFLCKQE